MRLEILQGLGRPSIVVDVSRVLITADDGVTQIAVATELDRGTIRAATVLDPGFKPLLKLLGIDRTTIATPIANLHKGAGGR